MQVRKLPVDCQPKARERNRDGELLAAISVTGLPVVKVADLYPGIVPCWVGHALSRLVDEELLTRVKLSSTSWGYQLTGTARAKLSGAKLFDVGRSILNRKQAAKKSKMGSKRNKSGTQPVQQTIPGMEAA